MNEGEGQQSEDKLSGEFVNAQGIKFSANASGVSANSAEPSSVDKGNDHNLCQQLSVSFIITLLFFSSYYYCYLYIV